MVEETKNEITTSEARATPETVSRCLEASLRVFMTLFSSRFERLFFSRFVFSPPPHPTSPIMTRWCLQVRSRCFLLRLRQESVRCRRGHQLKCLSHRLSASISPRLLPLSERKLFQSHLPNHKTLFIINHSRSAPRLSRLLLPSSRALIHRKNVKHKKEKL